MDSGRNAQSLRDLGRIFGRGVLPSADGALLERFVARRDEDAFEALVRRHGPMVRGVCRRLLSDPHDVEDAFQATFLVLVLKAGRIRDAHRLGPWLHGVAFRAAMKARGRRHVGLVGDFPGRETANDLVDVWPILDAELDKLPAGIREVLVLCLLQGATAEEAAGRLACPLGTVKSRLARGREALRTRLTARGVAPAAALAALSTGFTSPVSAALARATVAAATTSRIAPAIFALTRGVAPAMLSKSTVLASLVLGGITLAGFGTANYLKAQAQGQAAEAVAAAAGQPAPREESAANNLKQILAAFHNFHSATGRFPASAIYGADGQPKLSWRVAVLPYLDEGELYEEFKQDEPWDSPHNKALIERMPAVFRTPEYAAPAGETLIRGVVGKGAFFDGVNGVGMQDFLDGTSNTLALAVAEEPVPWTKPGDLAYVAGKPLPRLNRGDSNQWLIALADGVVRNVPIKDSFLRHIITRNGRETIGWPPPGSTKGFTSSPAKEEPAGPQGGMGMMGMGMMDGRMGMGMMDARMGAPGMAGAAGGGGSAPLPDLEQRLQRLEEKLDLVLKKLDSMSAEGGGAMGGFGGAGGRIGDPSPK